LTVVYDLRDEEWCLQGRWNREPLGPRTEIVRGT
jgi:hypothetical protein